MLKATARILAFLIVWGLVSGFPSPGREDDEPIFCKSVKVGMTEAAQGSATAAATMTALRALGYTPVAKVVSVNDAMAMLQGGGLDVVQSGVDESLNATGGTVRLTGQGAPTIARKGFADACGNVVKLMKNRKFASDMQRDLADQNGDPNDAAASWMRANPDTVSSWLKEVKTFNKKDGVRPVRAAFGL